MKFELDYKIELDDEMLDSTTIESNPESYRDSLGDDLSGIEGALVLRIDGQEYCAEYVDPLLRLCDQFISKLRWVLAGDTETVAYRNSEHCFAFVPAGESVELAFFTGTEMEIEDYVLDPTNIHLDLFAPAAISVTERVLEVMRKLAPNGCDGNVDCQDLQASLKEARDAWKDYQLHRR